MATSMAMIAPIRIVPQNSGIAPNRSGSTLPDAGFQLVPVRKAIGDTMLKKRADSNTSDRTIPIVVRIAISDAISSVAMTTRSTRVRARKSCLSRV